MYRQLTMGVTGLLASVSRKHNVGVEQICKSCSKVSQTVKKVNVSNDYFFGRR
jgi:hypothetical protein